MAWHGLQLEKKIRPRKMINDNETFGFLITKERDTRKKRIPSLEKNYPKREPSHTLEYENCIITGEENSASWKAYEKR